MSFFDALFGTNNTDEQDKATALANQQLAQTQANNNGILTNAAGQASGAVTGGVNNALASLLAANGTANNALTSYGGQAQGAINSGVNQAVGTVQGSNAAFQPYLSTGTAANTLYGNSLGLNGAAGNEAATNAFQASPGYQWQVDQSTDAAARKAASLGMAASGNTLDAITRLGSNLANQEYGSWQDRLNGLSTQGLTAANAISGNNAAAAGYQYGGGAANAGILSALGSGLSNNANTLGTGQASLQSGLGTALGNIDLGLGSSQVANNWTGTNGITKNSLNLASSQDAADNNNNGIFSSLLGKGLSLLGGTATGGALTSLFNKL